MMNVECVKESLWLIARNLTLSHPGKFNWFAQKQLDRTWLCTGISPVR